MMMQEGKSVRKRTERIAVHHVEGERLVEGEENKNSRQNNGSDSATLI